MAVTGVTQATTSPIHRLDLMTPETRWSRLQPPIAVARGFDVLS